RQRPRSRSSSWSRPSPGRRTSGAAALATQAEAHGAGHARAGDRDQQPCLQRGPPGEQLAAARVEREAEGMGIPADELERPPADSKAAPAQDEVSETAFAAANPGAQR